ncbi:MAG: imidazole glycerol phosphate synthase subunit HisH, partial [Planctomycetaceae bacterium]|nr:imidazole glycerol phosphate synthase subunit HisH [Planctomycetaceae bacterium]
WNQLQRADNPDAEPAFAEIHDGAWFYFVHSYYVDPSDESWIAARTDYGGPFVSVVARGNVMATQFHPEKSQKYGLQLLRNFVQRTASAPV